jgi:hypothetical protein
VTEGQYWEMFESIRGDILGAIESHHVYIAIRNLVAKDAEISAKVNRIPSFWHLNAYALQTTFFIAFGRIFDRTSGTWSIEDLVEATIDHPGFFSRETLRKRRREMGGVPEGDPDPDGLAEYLGNAWEPTRKDLEVLRTSLVPHSEKFKQIYQPIRHGYFAHRARVSRADVEEWFGKALVGDINEILRFLYTVVGAIKQMALDGKLLDLTNFRDYDRYVGELKMETEALLRSIGATR